jgi:endonuclease/exonuclease/phosphatase family metal-dependent hydrolase
MILRVLSLNAGLLSRFCGLLEPAPEVHARLAALPSALLSLEADVIALQEVYDADDRATLSRALKHVYPHVFASAATRAPRLGDGLVVFSRHPGEARALPYRDGPIEERWLAPKGVLSLRLPAYGELSIVSTHTTAGGLFRHPESPFMNAVRARQIDQLLDVSACLGDGSVVVAGDMNAGPGVSDENYRLFEARGYVDAYAALHPRGSGITWNPKNPLNVQGPHRRCPPQRIDHVFIRQRDLEQEQILLRHCAIVLDQATVPTSSGRRIPVSDHAGVLVELELLPTASRGA